MTSPESEAFISLGSNIRPQRNLYAALKLLREHCRVLAVSSAYRTPPQGDTNQPDFLNMAVKISTSLTPADFKTQVIAGIEARLGRVRDPHNKNAPRTIDLDISLWNHDVLDYGGKPWHIPEPDITRYAHVALPLAEIAPDYVHPETGQTLTEIANKLDATNIHKESFMTGANLFIVNPEGAIWHDGRYLMVVRGDAEEHASGALSFIGGGTDSVDAAENILELTVRREILEEVNVEVSDMAYVLSRTFTASDNLPVLYTIFLCRYHAGTVTINDPGEVAAALWLAPDEIRTHPNCPPWMQADIEAVEQRRRSLGW